MSRLTAVLLVGGEGTRLRPLTYEVPKPLVPVANRPLTSYSLRMLRRGGVGRAILATGYRAADVRKRLAGRQPDGLLVECAYERRKLGTAGGIKNALSRSAHSFIAMNGDQLMDVDVADVLEAHRERRAAITIVVTHVADVAAFGAVRFRADHRIECFDEGIKDPSARPPPEPGWINSGLYVWSPRVLDAIPDGQEYSNETQLFPSLIEAGERVYAYRTREGAYWTDVGTPRKYQDANRAILNQAVPWAERPTHPRRKCDFAPTARVARGARVGPNVSVGCGAEIGGGCTLRNSIVLRNARVHEGCTLENAIVMPDSEIAPGTVLTSEDGTIIVRGATETLTR